MNAFFPELTFSMVRRIGLWVLCDYPKLLEPFPLRLPKVLSERDNASAEEV
mgnify:CR=1 FL=1